MTSPTPSIVMKVENGAAVEVTFSAGDPVRDLNGNLHSARAVLRRFDYAQIEEKFGLFCHVWPTPPAGQEVDTRTATVVNGRVEFTQTFKAKMPAITLAQLYAKLLEDLYQEARDDLVARALRLTDGYDMDLDAAQIGTLLDGLNAAQKTALVTARAGLD